MAFQLRWTNPACEDLIGISRYISQDSPQNAITMTHRIMEAIATLSEFPHRGRVAFERGNQQYRVMEVSPYRVFYRIEEDVVFLQAIIHSARSLPFLEERWQDG